ncbi:DedA protein [Vibrio maritimus]|uniref:DedA protein n=1 Tax=Vibrio maritimus TaxID=990268 RepID=A0A090S6V8_9VIBR|nr:DedA protein [Vibrio maritimus]
MLDATQDVLIAIWNQDFDALLSPGSAVLIYILVTIFIGLESSFLPAAPLPCDSIVVLVGTLSAVGVLNPFLAFALLIIAAPWAVGLPICRDVGLTNFPLLEAG